MTSPHTQPLPVFPDKNWRFRSPTPPPPRQHELARGLQVSPLLVRLLWARGLKTREDMERFLDPRLGRLSLPDRWAGLPNAAEAVVRALNQGRTAAVWGDYDVDGITATALLLLFFRTRGIYAEHHIPHRRDEGYGLNIPGIEALAARGVGLLITVDCGIGHPREVARARELGMAVVVSDHHLPGPDLPDADAILNPKLGENPCPDLAGVGVAFRLAATLNRMLPGDHLEMEEFLDLVALGTLADVVNLIGENRILARNGLLCLQKGKRPGIFALKEACGYKPGDVLDENRVCFGLAPRINAAGRLGHAETALSLLLSRDLSEARTLAGELNMNNERRREIGRDILDQAQVQAKGQEDRFGLVLHGPKWHEGVIGIVASQIAETYYRPTVVLSGDESGVLKGSGRSIPEFHLHEGLAACRDILLGFGGHSQAAGVQLGRDRLDAFREAFNAVVARALGDQKPRPTLLLDADLGFKAVNFDLLKELELLAPFGPGNPRPLFRSPRVAVRSRRPFGKDHVFLEVRDEEAEVTLRAKAWNQARNIPQDVAGKTLVLAYTPKFNEFNGVSSIDLELLDYAGPDHG